MSSLLGRHISSVTAEGSIEDLSPDVQYAARPALPPGTTGQSSYNPSPTHSHMSVATPDLSLTRTSTLPPPCANFTPIGSYGHVACDFYPQSAPASNGVFRLQEKHRSHGFPHVDTTRVMSTGASGPASNSVSPVLPSGTVERSLFDDNDSDLSRSIPNDSIHGEQSSMQFGMVGTSMQYKANAKRIFISPHAYDQQIAAVQAASTAGSTTVSLSMRDSMHGPPTVATTVASSAMADSFSTHEPPTPPNYGIPGHSATMLRNYSHQHHYDSMNEEYIRDVKHNANFYADAPQTAPLPNRASSFDDESAAVLLSKAPYSAHVAGASTFSHRPFTHHAHTAHHPTFNVLQAQAAYDSYVAETNQDHSVTLSTGATTTSTSSSTSALPAPGGPWSVGFPTAANYAAYGMYGPNSVAGMNGRPEYNLDEAVKTIEAQNGATSFVSKLWFLLSQPQEFGEYIRWTVRGKAFILSHNSPTFGEAILSRFFRHSNIASFVRQLNLYKMVRMSQLALLEDLSDSGGRVDGELTHTGFAHPNLQRGHPELLYLIKPQSGRKRAPRSKRERAASMVMSEQTGLISHPTESAVRKVRSATTASVMS